MSSTNSNQIRMNSADVNALRSTIPSISELRNLINGYSRSHPDCMPSCKTMMNILEMVLNPPEAFLATPPVPIDVETTFGYSSQLFSLLTEKVVELVLMMRNADNDQFHPLSMGSIKNVGLSLFRRIFFIANEKAIREHTGGKIVYPFLNVEQELKDIMQYLFLTIYFSPICDSLIPLYVFAAIPFCRKRSPVYFNVKFPVENARHPDLNQYNLYGGVFNLKANNPPGSTPYHYEEH